MVDADNDFASQDKSAIASFPTKIELNQFDVVILGDVDPQDRRLGDKNLENLANFVRERGGGSPGHRRRESWPRPRCRP